MAKQSTNRQTEWFWKRLKEWYGEKLPAEPWSDLQPLVSRVDRATCDHVFTRLRNDHTTWPPTFPELAKIFEDLRKPAGSTQPLAERITEYVLAKHPEITWYQLSQPWRWVGPTFDAIGVDGKMAANHGVSITHVIIPEDPNEHRAPSFRVRVVDAHLWEPVRSFGDEIHAFGNRALLRFLRVQDKGATQKSLTAMVRAKNEICNAYRETPREHREEPSELAAVLLARFEKLYKALP